MYQCLVRPTIVLETSTPGPVDCKPVLGTMTIWLLILEMGKIQACKPRVQLLSMSDFFPFGFGLLTLGRG